MDLAKVLALFGGVLWLVQPLYADEYVVVQLLLPSALDQVDVVSRVVDILQFLLLDEYVLQDRVDGIPGPRTLCLRRGLNGGFDRDCRSLWWGCQANRATFFMLGAATCRFKGCVRMMV